MFWRKSPEQERNYAIKSIKDFLADTGGDMDWDNFTTYSLRHKVLDQIRKDAFEVDLPLNPDGRNVLEQLLKRLKSVDLS